MSGADRVVWNTLERLTSPDLNEGQTLAARTLSELFRFMFEERFVAAADQFGTRIERNVVLGGFNVVPNVNDIDVGIGALLQYSAGLAPAPGALDSPYRIARNVATTTVVMPAPGVTTWYLVEAQMVEAITLNTSVDIFNPGTQTFAPAARDKRAERQVQFQVVPGAGSNYPAPSGGDWVPICGVRRPGGGGPVAPADIDDLRPLWNSAPGSFGESNAPTKWLVSPVIDTTHEEGGAVSENLAVLGGVRQDLHELRFSSTAAVSFGAGSAYIDPTTVLAADTWYYLYLVPWQRLAPGSHYAISPMGRGIIVLSHVAPLAAGSAFNGAALNLPAPWGVATVPLLTGPCIGAVRRNATNNGWDMQKVAGDGWHMFEPLTALASFAPPIIGTNVVTLTGKVPLCASAWRLRIRHGENVAGTTLQIVLSKTGAGGVFHLYDGDVENQDTYYVDVPTAFLGGTSFEVALVGANAPATLSVQLIAARYPGP